MSLGSRVYQHANERHLSKNIRLFLINRFPRNFLGGRGGVGVAHAHGINAFAT